VSTPSSLEARPANNVPGLAWLPRERPRSVSMLSLRGNTVMRVQPPTTGTSPSSSSPARFMIWRATRKIHLRKRPATNESASVCDLSTPPQGKILKAQQRHRAQAAPRSWDASVAVTAAKRWRANTAGELGKRRASLARAATVAQTKTAAAAAVNAASTTHTPSQLWLLQMLRLVVSQAERDDSFRRRERRGPCGSDVNWWSRWIPCGNRTACGFA
jgi:hypothetical protein